MTITIDFLFIFEIIKWIFIILDAALLFGFLYATKKNIGFRKAYIVEPAKNTKTGFTLRKAIFEERWEKINKKIEAGTQESIKLALIEADALADSLLKEMGLPGEHMADRLSELSSDDVKSLEGLWRAHKVRNNLVHTPGFGLTFDEAHQTISDYAAFFKELELL